jgi:23S rRNA pseudouridine1911/1915/1917 synthase
MGKTIRQRHILKVPDSKLASLDYTIFKELNNYALEINLHTGRRRTKIA